ncbi:M23 family metallopeptidase [Paenibacillus rhizophilus]|nr:M23 family metallopeptidase [Paenibacillus rhizophilus]
MKSQSDKITLLVVRDAGRPVRQLQLSRPMAMALPAAAVLSLSSLISSMHYHASRSMQELEAEAAALSSQNVRLEAKIADKEKTLQQVQSEAAGLSKEAKAIKERLKSVDALEQELQNLINQQKEDSHGKESTADMSVQGTGSASGADSGSKAIFAAPAHSASPSAITIRIGAFTAAIDDTPALRVGGEYVASYGNGEIRTLLETKDELTELSGMLEEMVRSLSRTVLDAQKAEADLQQQKLRHNARQMHSFLWPTSSRTVSSSFGYRTDPFKGSSSFHAGIDIAAQTGDFIFAAQSGTILAAEWSAARGNYIVIDHGNGLQTSYMHLSSSAVSAGDKVVKGQRIGQVGSTGRSTGPHLHFQVSKQNKTVNPLSYVQPN